MERQIEVLAPAGSMDSLKAAVASGADAVYLGGKMFGARAFADNFTEEQMLEAIDYVHLHGRKLYLTVNTLLKEEELEHELYSYLLPFYRQGLDAVIVQDMGVLRFVRANFPGMDLHASTQMTITGTGGAALLKEEGVCRVVPARELSLGEIHSMAEATGMEIECFVHGALCYCYSGQCLFSSFLGGRSGNRGQCAQPCRLKYRTEDMDKPQYLMSLKDICTVEWIPALVEAGICSFKIEGRMKKPEYVAGVTAMYRKYTDLYLQMSKEKGIEYATGHFRVEESDKAMLMDLYNRGGFHSGYYGTRNGRDMLSLERPNHAGVPAVRTEGKKGRYIYGKVLCDLNPQDVIELPARKGKENPDNYTCGSVLRKGSRIEIPAFAETPCMKGTILYRTRNSALLDELRLSWSNKKVQEKIKGKFILREGESAKLELLCGNIRVDTVGETVQKAKNRPMERERIAEQMQKTGNTPFVFEKLDVELDESIFFPIQQINEIRRRGLEALSDAVLAQFRRETRRKELQNRLSEKKENTRMPIHVQVQTLSQLEVVLQHAEVKRVYVEHDMFSRELGKKESWMAGKIRDAGKEAWAVLPHVFREDTRKKYEDAGDWLESWDGILIRNLESFAYLRKMGFAKPVITDYNLYQFNRQAQEFLRELGAKGGTFPLELTASELRNLGLEESEMIVYGRLPLMVTAGCIRKTTGKCLKESGTTTLIDRYRKSFVVKNNCDECYNVIYNAEPLWLADKMEEIRTLSPVSLRLLFTDEEAERVVCTINEYVLALGGRKPEVPDYPFTRGHFKHGIK